jgi:hypothetical protein
MSKNARFNRPLLREKLSNYLQESDEDVSSDTESIFETRLPNRWRFKISNLSSWAFLVLSGLLNLILLVYLLSQKHDHSKIKFGSYSTGFKTDFGRCQLEENALNSVLNLNPKS